MLKILRIKQSSEFKKISQTGKKFHAKSLILLCAKTDSRYFCDQDKGQNAKTFCRVGFTVSKRVGNAVTRNKAKRRLREAARKLLPEYGQTNFDYIIIAKSAINDADLKKIISDLKFCLKRIDHS